MKGLAQMNPNAARPLSPHLQVYRFSLLMALSILHRITGVGNYLGAALFVWWLTALASGPSAYGTFQAVAGSPIGILVLIGFTWSVIHHLFGGVRHLVWDTGAAFKVPVAKRMGLVTAIAPVVLTALVWIAVLVIATAR
jgi:succinate dehydrogenase / fumarate reductase cytochrome b subunit